MNVEQMADFMNLSALTVRNMIGAQSMPFATYKEGKQHYADLNDVAAYHDLQMQMAREAMHAFGTADA